MAPQEKISILAEILDGYFISVVVSKVFGVGRWFSMLQVPDYAEAFDINRIFPVCKNITVYPGDITE